MELYLLSYNISSSSYNFAQRTTLLTTGWFGEAGWKGRNDEMSDWKPIPTIGHIWCKIVPVGKTQTRGRMPDDPLHKNERQRKRFSDHRQHGS